MIECERLPGIKNNKTSEKGKCRMEFENELNSGYSEEEEPDQGDEDSEITPKGQGTDDKLIFVKGSANWIIYQFNTVHLSKSDQGSAAGCCLDHHKGGKYQNI